MRDNIPSIDISPSHLWLFKLPPDVRRADTNRLGNLGDKQAVWVCFQNFPDARQVLASWCCHDFWHVKANGALYG